VLAPDPIGEHRASTATVKALNERPPETAIQSRGIGLTGFGAGGGAASSRSSWWAVTVRAVTQEDPMDDPPNRDGMRRRGLSRPVVRRYVLVSAVLALLRVTLLICIDHQFESDALNEACRQLQWGLFPEALLLSHTSLGVMDITRLGFLVGGGAVLAAGSFVLASPILLAGWVNCRRR
jgi:hypothetical protein